MPNAELQRKLRATFAGLAANLLLGTGKLAAGIYGHSDALIADAQGITDYYTQEFGATTDLIAYGAPMPFTAQNSARPDTVGCAGCGPSMIAPTCSA